MQELAIGVAEQTEPSSTYNLTHNPYVAKVKDMRGDLLVQHNATLSIPLMSPSSCLCALTSSKLPVNDEHELPPLRPSEYLV